MVGAKRVVKKTLKFEEAMERVEAVITEMESGALSLEESLERFEEGIRLSRFCAKKLDEAEKRIAVLLGEADERREEPFDPEARNTEADQKG